MGLAINSMKRLILTGAIALALTACSANPNNPIAPTNPAVIQNNVLQFAVGTARLPNGTLALNVVTTYRQPAGAFAPGDSGALVDTPTLTLPAPVAGPAGTATGYDALSTVLTGPAAGEIGTTSIGGSSQATGTTTVTTFGQSGGAFGLGIEPFNSYGPANAPSFSQIGTPFQVAPYPVPLYDQTASDPNQFVPWGGPPAFVLPNSNGDSVVGNSNYPSGTAGVSEGIDVFASIAPVAGGTYGLSVSVPANTGTATSPPQSFTLPAGPPTVGPATAPSYSVTTNSFTGFSLPAQASEAYVQVVDYGPNPTAATQPASCNGSSAANPVYYTLWTNTSTLPTLPAAQGPNGTPTICSAAQNTATNSAATPGDDVVVQEVGFDYPAYEMSYTGVPGTGSAGTPNPPYVGGQKSDDLSISPAVCTYDSGGGVMASCTASLPLAVGRGLPSVGRPGQPTVRR